MLFAFTLNIWAFKNCQYSELKIIIGIFFLSLFVKSVMKPEFEFYKNVDFFAGPERPYNDGEPSRKSDGTVQCDL